MTHAATDAEPTSADNAAFLEALAGRFPVSFRWGLATSAYQVEGSPESDGRGKSIWDVFATREGVIADGSDGAIATDSYRRYPEDIELLSWFGADLYRMSVSWPRVIPAGTGAVEPRGIAYYDRVVDALLARGIEPWITLYHWDLPQALEDRGGWTVRSTAEAFADYVDIVTSALGDRVRTWMTVNEPICVCADGYLTGEYAPGRRDEQAFVLASHHLLLGHGLAVPIIRRNAPSARVGVVVNPKVVVPASDAAEDVALATQRDAELTRWYLDPLAGRGYPEEALAAFNTDLRHVHDGDMAAIATPVDFFGLNYYTRHVASAGTTPREVVQLPVTLTGYEVYPAGLTEMLTRLHGYGVWPEFVITENGATFDDHADETGRVDDTRRLEFFAAHLHAAADALEAGVPLSGFIAWSLLDNFEWNLGYTARFGLTHVDFATQQRTVKRSGRWWRDLIATHRNQHDHREHA